MFEKLRQCLALCCVQRTLKKIRFQIHRRCLERESESIQEGEGTFFVIMRDESSLSHNVADEEMKPHETQRSTWEEQTRELLNIY